MRYLLSAFLLGSTLCSQPLLGRETTIEASAGDARDFHIEERLARYKVPGISIAVVDGGHIRWARGFGVRSPGGPPVDTRTLFQAGSLSKPVSAAAALIVASSRRLPVDRPINDMLAGFRLADGVGPAREVTLRRLLSHSGGINIHGFRGYALGEPLPTLNQVLDGAAPANSPRVTIDGVPGAGIDYSGGGYVIVQKAVEDIGGQPFATAASRTVLKAAGMRDSLYATTLSGGARDRAAAGYRADGGPIAGGWHRFVELAPAGLWTTASDMARFSIWLSGARNSIGRAMLTRQTNRAGEVLSTPGGSAAGLGILLDGVGPAFRFSHAGANPGQKAFLVYFPGTGQGAVIMANGDAAPRLIQELLTDFASAYHWPDPLLPRSRPAPVGPAPVANPQAR